MDDKYELHVISTDSVIREKCLYAISQLCQSEGMNAIYYIDAYGDLKVHIGAEGGILPKE